MMALCTCDTRDSSMILVYCTCKKEAIIIIIKKDSAQTKLGTAKFSDAIHGVSISQHFGSASLKSHDRSVGSILGTLSFPYL